MCDQKLDVLEEMEWESPHMIRILEEDDIASFFYGMGYKKGYEFGLTKCLLTKHC